MSTFVTVGVAHHDAPLACLERVAGAARAELQRTALAVGCAEVLVLSTCSRIEVHAVLDDAHGQEPVSDESCARVAESLAAALVGRGGTRPEDGVAPASPAVSVAVGDDAVRHLFRVAAGLDSRIVGEVEVQAQLRAAARVAAAVEGEPHRLRRLVAAAVAAARDTSRTGHKVLRRGLLAERAVARALAAVGRERTVEAVVVGAGTMGRQVVDALPGRGCRAALLSRTSSARSGGPRVHPLDELPSRLASADMLFVATSAGRRILSTTVVREALRERCGRPLVIVDLALPRNVDPGVADVPGVRLLDLDDLGDAGSGTAPDPRALAAVESATRAAAERYCAEIRSRRAGPIISALRSHVEEVCLQQLRRTTRGVAVPDDALTRMAAAVAGAVAHSPTVLARQAAADDDLDTLALLAAAFRLDDEGCPQDIVAG